MYTQILSLERRIPDFNHRAFSFDDFLSLCEQKDIAVNYWPFVPPVQGFYLDHAGRKSVGLARDLQYPEKTLIAFQELGHCILEHGNCFTLETYTYSTPSREYNARVFAVLAVLPTPILEREGDEALAIWPQDFREFRWRVYQNYLKGKKGG